MPRLTAYAATMRPRHKEEGRKPWRGRQDFSEISSFLRANKLRNQIDPLLPVACHRVGPKHARTIRVLSVRGCGERFGVPMTAMSRDLGRFRRFGALPLPRCRGRIPPRSIMARLASMQDVKGRTGTAFFLATLLLLGIAAIGFPIFIIRPFVYQAPVPLRLALIVERWAPSVTLIALLAGVLMAFRGRAVRGERYWITKNALLLAAVAVLGLCAWAARINPYERLLFHPRENSQFILASQASLSQGEMVIAVSINHEERAYPILQMAYHHVFNDVVGGVPIAATY